jgi:hypothetical protein
MRSIFYSNSINIISAKIIANLYSKKVEDFEKSNKSTLDQKITLPSIKSIKKEVNDEKKNV